MPRQGLSQMQKHILEVIEEGARAGNPPSIREIGDAVGIVPSNVLYHLNKLRDKGVIERDLHRSRGISLKRQPGPHVIGEIAAGQPLAIFDPGEQDVLDVGKHVRNPDEFALRVRGESMIEDHIFDGDFVLVQPANEAHNGQIIVAVDMSANGERGAATLKRFYKEKGKVRLQPANSTMEPIIISEKTWARDWQVQGCVTAVYRPV